MSLNKHVDYFYKDRKPRGRNPTLYAFPYSASPSMWP